MTNPEDPGKETRLVDVKGRSIVVRQLNDAQLLLLGREARLASRETTNQDRKLSGIARVFDILESAVVQEEDREYLMDLTVAGELELKDMMDFITAFGTGEEDKPKVRRGRYATKRS
jgi:hypothetical protein